MTQAPQRLSAGSLDRYRFACAQIGPRVGAAWAGKAAVRAGIVDRKSRNAVAVLDLTDGQIRSSSSEIFDLIFVEQPRPGDRNDPDFLEMKTRLDADGVIVLRRQRPFARWVGRWLSRRQDDLHSSAFGSVHDRREASLRRASLYLTEFTTTSPSGKESWLIASTKPIDDQRFRDQIGRVATDYLRALPPIMITVATQLPGL